MDNGSQYCCGAASQAIYGGLYHIPGTQWMLPPHSHDSTCMCCVCCIPRMQTLRACSSQSVFGFFSAGVVVLGEGSLARQLFMNFVWLVGTYLFAAVLGVITGDIMERIQVHFTAPCSLTQCLLTLQSL